MHVANIMAGITDDCGGPPKSTLGLGKFVAQNNITVSYWSTCNERDKSKVSVLDSEVHCYKTTWPQAWFRCPGLVRNLERELQSIDILHIQEVWSHPQYATARLARRYDKPYIIVPHGELEPWRIRSKGFKKHVYLSLMGRRMLNGAACLHAITPLEVEGFRRVGYTGPVAIIPNGVNPDDFADMPAPFEAEGKWPQLTGRRVVLFLSRLSQEKGLDQFFPAWAQLTRGSSYDDALLVLAGPDDRGYRATAEAFVQKHNLESKVLFTGMVSGREKAALISRADIYTLPSYSEGFSISILENLAASKPMLITPGCNFPEVSRVGAGLCVEPESAFLEEAMKKLLDMSKDKLREMGQQGRNLVLKNYTWDIAARKMITVYRSILEGKEIPLYPNAAACSL